MKKSNKISCFYILASIALFLVLSFGGIYGVYISVGLNFMRSTLPVAPEGGEGASNVSFGGSVNFESSMTGVVILSIALIVLAVFDLISLIKQIVFFKQFKMIKKSKIENAIEKKVKSKGSIIFFAIVIDIISFAVGVAGIVLNIKTLSGNNFSWILYLIDGLVAILSLMSFVLLCVKLKGLKKPNDEEDPDEVSYDDDSQNDFDDDDNYDSDEYYYGEKFSNFNIDDFEYKLLKLKNLKSSKIISNEEYENLRQRFLASANVNDNNKKSDNF